MKIVKTMLVIITLVAYQACHACGGGSVASIGHATSPPAVSQAALAPAAGMIVGPVLAAVGVLALGAAGSSVAFAAISVSAVVVGIAIAYASATTGTPSGNLP